MTEITGFVEPGFEPVRDAFAANFEREPDAFNAMIGIDVCEVGAGVSVFHRGRPVVELWGGEADRRTHRPYDDQTLQLVFSTSKGVTAICANLLAQRGLLDLDAKVTDYWPEFAQAGKADIPVRWLLSHRAGLPWVDVDMTIEQALDWDQVISAGAAVRCAGHAARLPRHHVRWLSMRSSCQRQDHQRSCATSSPAPGSTCGSAPQPAPRVSPLIELPTIPTQPMVDVHRPRVHAGQGPVRTATRAEHMFGSFNLPGWSARSPRELHHQRRRSLLYAARPSNRRRRPPCLFDPPRRPGHRTPDRGRRPRADKHGHAVRRGFQPAQRAAQAGRSPQPLRRRRLVG
jgi:hypothetical protein